MLSVTLTRKKKSQKSKLRGTGLNASKTQTLCEALGSNPSTTKNKQTNKNKPVSRMKVTQTGECSRLKMD
jgi:hypothetical protein